MNKTYFCWFNFNFYLFEKKGEPRVKQRRKVVDEVSSFSPVLQRVPVMTWFPKLSGGRQPPGEFWWSTCLIVNTLKIKKQWGKSRVSLICEIFNCFIIKMFNNIR